MDSYAVPFHFGPSPSGWHSMQALYECEQRYVLQKQGVRPLRLPGAMTDSDKRLVIGSMVHQGRAQWLADGGKSTGYRKAMAAWAKESPERPHPAEVVESLRLMDAYVIRYQAEWFGHGAHWKRAGRQRVAMLSNHAAVEYMATDKETGVTARYDAVMRLTLGGRRGAWINELKTAGKLTPSREPAITWGLDGQTLTQAMCWGSEEIKRWGPLQGIVRDVLVKTLQPQFARFYIPFSVLGRALAAHRKEIIYMQDRGSVLRGELGPRDFSRSGRSVERHAPLLHNWQSCQSPSGYDPCEFRALCLYGLEGSRHKYTFPEEGSG